MEPQFSIEPFNLNKILLSRLFYLLSVDRNFIRGATRPKVEGKPIIIAGLEGSSWSHAKAGMFPGLVDVQSSIRNSILLRFASVACFRNKASATAK